MIAIESGKLEVAACRRGVKRAYRQGSGGPQRSQGEPGKGWGGGNHPRRSLLGLSQNEAARTAHCLGITMSSVSLESKKQGRESKVETVGVRRG